MTHRVVHENNISNNTHNIAQGAILFSGGQMPPECNPASNYTLPIGEIINCIAMWVQKCDAGRDEKLIM